MYVSFMKGKKMTDLDLENKEKSIGTIHNEINKIHILGWIKKTMNVSGNRPFRRAD